MGRLAKELGYTAEHTAEVVSAIVDIMSEELQAGNAVQVQNFGTFEVKKRMERISVIPDTGQRILVPPKLVLSFKPASALKESLQ